MPGNDTSSTSGDASPQSHHRRIGRHAPLDHQAGLDVDLCGRRGVGNHGDDGRLDVQPGGIAGRHPEWDRDHGAAEHDEHYGATGHDHHGATGHDHHGAAGHDDYHGAAGHDDHHGATGHDHHHRRRRLRTLLTGASPAHPGPVPALARRSPCRRPHQAWSSAGEPGTAGPAGPRRSVGRSRGSGATGGAPAPG